MTELWHGIFYMICKKAGLRRDMADYVAEARLWATELVKRELAGRGDLQRAMRCVARHCGIDYSVLYDLRYRPPKSLVVHVYESLRAAYLAERERQENLLSHERKVTEAKSLAAPHYLRAADLICRPDRAEDETPVHRSRQRDG